VDRRTVTALVFVTQKIDERDSVLGFVPRLVTALADRVGAVTVIANEVTSPLPALPTNVSVASLGKERGASRVARGLRYERLLAGAARRGRADALLAHMCPEYLDLAAPVAKSFRLPLMLWFAHPARSQALTIADRLADAVLTSLPGAYPIDSPKVHVIGQATDVRGLPPCEERTVEGPFRVVAIGRTSPAKRFDVVIRAAAMTAEKGRDVEVRIVGPSVTPEEERHRDELAALVDRLGVGRRVRIVPGVPPVEVRDVICGADVLVNAMVAGSGDKVVFEAAALGRPVVVSNPAFRDLLAGLPLDLTFPEGEASILAERLHTIANADAATLRETTETLRGRVEREHSLDHWADAVVRIAETLIARRRRWPLPWRRGR
jgi:glycosyltransferase involved in cell wall biosynthesis